MPSSANKLHLKSLQHFHTCKHLFLHAERPRLVSFSSCTGEGHIELTLDSDILSLCIYVRTLYGDRSTLSRYIFTPVNSLALAWHKPFRRRRTKGHDSGYVQDLTVLSKNTTAHRELNFLSRTRSMLTKSFCTRSYDLELPYSAKMSDSYITCSRTGFPSIGFHRMRCKFQRHLFRTDYYFVAFVPAHYL